MCNRPHCDWRHQGWRNHHVRLEGWCCRWEENLKLDCESDPLRLRSRLTTAIFAVWRRCIAGALLALTACASPPPPPPPPLVTLAPAEGVVLTVDVFRVPEGVAWSEVESDCANGVWRPGDIEMVDRRQEPGSADQPCFRVQWTNGLKLRWEGCDQLAYPDQPRYRRFRILGVFAARAIVGRRGSRLGRGGLVHRGLHACRASVEVEPGEAGWGDSTRDPRRCDVRASTGLAGEVPRTHGR